MERVFDTQMGRIKTKLIKICSLVDEQFECIHESFKEYDSARINKVLAGNEEIKLLKENVERNCQKIIVLTQPVAKDLRDVLIYLKINLLFENYSEVINNQLNFLEKHSTYTISFDLKDLYEASYFTLDIIKSSFDAFIVNDIKLANRIIALQKDFYEMIETNSLFLAEEAKNHPESLYSCFNIHTFLNELKHLYNYSMELCKDVLLLNEKKNEES